MSKHDSEGPDAAFARLLGEAEEIQRRLAGVHRSLAEGPSSEGEQALDALRAARDETLVRLGVAALAWRSQGGVIELSEGALRSRAESVRPRALVTRPPSSPPMPRGSSGGTSIVGVSSGSLSGDPDGIAGQTLGEGLGEAVIDESDDDVVDLSIIDSLVLNNSWSGENSFDPGFSLEALQEIILRLGPPRERLTDDDLLAEAAVLDTELTRINRWGQFPRGIQRALLGLVACRMRRLQDDTPSRVRVVLELQLRRGFARLTQFSSEYQPGWVTGLSRQHKPESDSWLSDAHYWWNTLQRELGSIAIEQQKAHLNPEVSLNDLRSVLERRAEPAQVQKAANRALRAGVSPEDPRLVGLLKPHMGLLAGDKSLKRVRKAIREAVADEVVEDDGPLPADWPLRAQVAGSAAVMVGGVPDEARRARLEESFDLGSLSWVAGDDQSAVDAVAERLERGEVDLLILAGRFLDHGVTDRLLPACNQAEVAWVMVREGVGVGQIAEAMERYLGGWDDGAP